MKTILLLSLLVMLSACGKSVNRNGLEATPPAIVPPLTGSGQKELVFNSSPDGLGGAILTDIVLVQNLNVVLPSSVVLNSSPSTSNGHEMSLSVVDSLGTLVYNCLFKKTSGVYQRLNCSGTLVLDVGDTLKVNNIPVGGTVKALVEYSVR